MDALREPILVAGAPDSVVEILRQAGYDVVDSVAGVALIGGDEGFSLLASLKSQHPTMRVIVLAADAAGKIRALDQAADDALSDPWEAAELLARVRAQFRAYQYESELRSQTRIAEEGFEVAQTAFHALAVTE